MGSTLVRLSCNVPTVLENIVQKKTISHKLATRDPSNLEGVDYQLVVLSPRKYKLKQEAHDPLDATDDSADAESDIAKPWKSQHVGGHVRSC